MPFELIIARYGLAAVCIGAGVEGETAVMAGGVLAHQQLVSLPSVATAAAIGSFVADQCFFSVGRHFRDRAWVQNRLGKPAARRAVALLERYPDRFILAIRFLYGIRTLSPIAVGTSDIARARFMSLNAVAAVFWAILFTTIGYELGDGLKALFRHVHPFMHVLTGAFVVVVGALLLVRLVCRRYHHRAAALPDEKVRPAA
jgi:membrane protein DedA with SNARE-associated domain